jgi:hypothetical protein
MPLSIPLTLLHTVERLPLLIPEPFALPLIPANVMEDANDMSPFIYTTIRVHRTSPG